jgi:hypothetical protein
VGLLRLIPAEAINVLHNADSIFRNFVPLK